ncbi:P-loop containing nucleoside triphosphate hydrolase protein [Pelagophyceae sp. CCMP2097]|nr:P-loop containing nucleoside triphosphate hydrolase protein [Pelagophyceae sp. CCMP2097]
MAFVYSGRDERVCGGSAARRRVFDGDVSFHFETDDDGAAAGAPFCVGDYVVADEKGLLQPAQIAEIDGDACEVRLRWLCPAERLPKKQQPLPPPGLRAGGAARELFETDEEDWLDAEAVRAHIRVSDADAFAKCDAGDADAFFVRYCYRFNGGKQLVHAGIYSHHPKRLRPDEDVRTEDRLRRAAAALQLSATPTKLQCREKERSQIDGFLREFLRDKKGDGRLLYISGMPGTGKTATVREVVAQLRADDKSFDFLDINGMCLPHATHAYSVLWKFLARARPERVSHEIAARKLEAFFTARAARDSATDDDHPYTIVLLDELDFMVTRTQAVLYNLFEWPSRKRSRLAIIGPWRARHGAGRRRALGIANTMDLPERLVPKVRSRLGARRISFMPYKNAELEKILRQRLGADLASVFDGQAIKLAGAKGAAYSGDVRKALQMCVKAIDICRGRHRDAGELDADKMVVTAADVLDAHKLLGESAYIAAIELASPMEAMLLVALCVELRGSENVSFAALQARVARFVALASDATYARAPTHAELLDVVARLVDARLVATYAARDARLPALFLNVDDDAVADVLVASDNALAIRFLKK